MKFVKRNTTKGSEGSNVTIKSYSNSSSSSSSSLTSHNIWGQPFDGTNDVTGDMQNVGSITATGNIQTDGDIIIKQLDTDGNEVEGGDLTMSVENADAQFSGKENYIFDGKIKGNSAEITNNIEVGGKGSFGSDLTVKGISKLKDVTSNNISNADTIRTKNLESYGNSTLNDVTSNNITNSDTIKTKNLEVTGSAHFFELIIDKIKAAGGAALFTPADGFDIDIVEANGTSGYKLYWQCQDGNGKQRDNMWKVNDQALCMSFNQAKVGTSHSVNNKYYWCLVTDVSDSSNPTLIDGEYYNYIVISSTVCDGTVNPEKGDSIVMCGYRGADDKARQSAIYISAYSSLDKGLTAPLLAQYQGINDFNLESHRKSYFDATHSKIIGDFVVEASNKNLVDLINDVNSQVTENKTNIANLTVKADGIESTVSSMSNGNGTNLFSFTNANFNDYHCMPAIQMNGFFTLGLGEEFYRVANLGTNGVTGDYVVSFDARVLKGRKAIKVNFCSVLAEERKSVILLFSQFKHYVLHFKNVHSDYLNVDSYNGFINFTLTTPDANNQLYVANFMVERGTIPSNNFSLSEADKNNFKSNNVFTAFDKASTVQIVDETINGNAVKAYKQEGLPKDTEYIDILAAYNLQKKFKVENWKVYTLSFYAKTLRGRHKISNYLYPNLANAGLQNILYKDINGAGTQSAYTAIGDGYTLCELDTTWRKFYVHWQPHTIGAEYQCICGRLSEDKDENGDKVVVYIAEPKLEEGYICDENISNQDTYSSIKQTAESITSTVSSMKDEMIGENCMLGLNGQGWSSNTIYQDAGNAFYCESTDWFQSPPIADFSGDYTFSFSFWGGNMQIKILDFTQTYYDDGIYDQYVDFSVYKPCKILTTSSNVSNVDLSNYATSGTSSTWTYTNTEAITLAVGDNVAVRVTNNTNNRYNSIYGTVSAINTSTKSVTVKAIALLDQPNTICTLSCPTDKKDGTDINSLHYDDKLGRYWIRFKESSVATKTFVMLFKNLDTSSIGYISRLMIEEGVERPHKYNGTSQASQSMIKQTANEIIAQVNDTYVKIGNGNITINGDTKVEGSLTLNDSKQGFLLLGNGGTTEISPKSIGSYSAFKDRTSNTIRTHYLSDIKGELNIDTNTYEFFWSVTQKIGTYKKGDYIKFTNYANDVVTNIGTDIGTPYAKFYINENGTQTKTIDIGVKTNVDIDYYTVVNDNADIQVTGIFTIYAPKSIWNKSRGIDTNLPNTPFISVRVEWNNEVPNKNSFMLIGYDGFGVNFGTNKTVYCGAEGFIASYGDSLFKITSDGIVEKKNTASVAIIDGSSNKNSPAHYYLKEGVDTILCKSGYTIITLPSEPSQGQSVKIFDKSPQETWIDFQGYIVGANSTYDSRTHQTKFALDGTVVRTFTFIGDTWFMEYMG